MSKSKSKTKATNIMKRVRFSLPQEIESDDEGNESNRTQAKFQPRNNEQKVHGTARYINGTLDFCQNDISATKKATGNASNVIPVLRIDRANGIVNPYSECRNVRKGASGEDKFHSNCWTKSFHDYRTPEPIPYKKNNTKLRRIRSCTTILFSPTKCMRSSCLPKPNRSTHPASNQHEVSPLYTSYERLNYKLSELKVGGEKSFSTYFSSKLRNANKNKK